MKISFMTTLVVSMVLFAGLSAAEDAVFDLSTNILSVPRVAVGQDNYSTEFTLGADGKFTLTKAAWVPSGNIGDASISGVYKGVRTNFGTFNYASTEATITISGQNMSLNLDSFMNGECRLTGSVTTDHFSASGDFQCSDFTSGTWTSQYIKADVEVLTAIIHFTPGGGFDSSVFTGIKFSDD